MKARILPTDFPKALTCQVQKLLVFLLPLFVAEAYEEGSRDYTGTLVLRAACSKTLGHGLKLRPPIVAGSSHRTQTKVALDNRGFTKMGTQDSRIPFSQGPQEGTPKVLTPRAPQSRFLQGCRYR